MAEEPEAVGRGPWLGPAKALISVGVVAMVYGLAMDPSYRFLRVGTISQHTFSTIYFSVIYLSERSDSIDQFLNWYLNFWCSDVREMDRRFREQNPQK